MPRKITPKHSYQWTGFDTHGQKQQGIIEAPNKTMAKIALLKQQIIISSLTKKRWFSGLPIYPRVTTDNIRAFSQQLATLMTAGIPLLSSFDILAKETGSSQMTTVILSLKRHITEGATLTEAFQKYPQLFNELYCHLVFVGEKSGTLPFILNDLVQYQETMATLKKKIKHALTYPIAVLILAGIITLGLLLFVIPQFQSLFQNVGAELPSFTRAVIAVSQGVKHELHFLILLPIGVYYAVRWARRRFYKVHQISDNLLLTLPLIGPLIRQAIITRFSRTLFITFSAGLPLVQALHTISGTVSNLCYKKAVDNIHQELLHGQSLALAMKQTQVFPNKVIQMITLGEESGTLDHMLQNIATIYEKDLENTLDTFSRLLEPLFMALLGLLVGSLVIAMYLPLFQLGSVIS